MEVVPMRGGPLQIVADTLRTTTKTGKLCSANLSPSPTIRLEGRGRLSERPVRNARISNVEKYSAAPR